MVYFAPAIWPIFIAMAFAMSEPLCAFASSTQLFPFVRPNGFTFSSNFRRYGFLLALHEEFPRPFICTESTKSS